jgi:ABC-type dipeptide/oligopeptide/nickel transport system permease component
MTGRYLLQRLLHSVLVVLGVSLIVFLISHLTGDPAVLMAQPGATEKDLQALRERLGLDAPLPVQYLRFVGGAAHGDFGNSIWQNQPVLGLILDRLPATLQLTASAMLVALGLAFPVGIAAALNRNSIVDRLVMLLALAGQSVPVFWLGLMLILVFSVNLHWLPSSSTGTWQHLVLPAVTLGAFSMARTARLVRSGLLEVLGLDYVRTARAKGLGERAVILRHALRNGLIPVVTSVGLELGALLGGAVITETIFAWPGVGRLIVQAIFNRDFPLVQAAVFVLSLIFIGVNLATDALYTVLDPRIRYA